MGKTIMERVIEFPLPNWDKSFLLSKNSKNSIRCLCYQNTRNNHYGPYGFETPTAEKLILSIGKLMLFNEKTEKLEAANVTLQNGIYVSEQSKGYGNFQFTLANYQKWKMKKKFYQKLEKPFLDEIITPDILKILNHSIMDISIIEKITKENIDILVSKNYSPEAGRTLIFFGENLLSKVKLFCEANNIRYLIATSIDELTAW